MKKLSLIFTISFLLAFIHLIAFSQSVSVTGISPASPSSLNFNQKVTINFNYSMRVQSGVRIFMRPFTAGKLAPNYAASGSPVYRGRGTGTANFTITKGNVKIDQIRVQVLSAAQNRLLFEFYLPVELTYASSAFTLVKPQIFNKNIIKAQPQQFELAAPKDTLPDEVTEVRRLVKPDGIIEIHYSDGSIKGIISWDHWYMIDPTTGDTSYTKLMLNQVQGAGEPADPPGLFASTTTEVDDSWLNNLNAWIEYLGIQLLERIELIVNDPESFQNYKTFEEQNSSTLYERVNLRYTFLEKLLKLSPPQP